jgi:hypothetical protein
MPAPLSKPSRRTQVTLYEADCQQLERRYGRGWTEQVRLLVEKNCKEYLRHKSEMDTLIKLEPKEYGK